jgi:hypothetical protein
MRERQQLPRHDGAQPRVAPFRAEAPPASSSRDSRVRPGQVPALQRSIGNRAIARELMPTSGRRLQRMLWVIEQPEGSEKKLSKEVVEDLKRLRGSAAAPIDDSDFEEKEVSLTAGHASQQAAHVHHGAPLHLLSHAGLVPEPWIGGMAFQNFAASLVSKYPGGALEASTVWLLVCFVGRKMDELLAALAGAGLQNVTVYAPRSLMFISRSGIPHVHERDDASYQRLTPIVAKYDADYLSLAAAGAGFQGTGRGWVGGRLVGGNAELFGKSNVETAVKEKFDPEGDED